MLSHSLNTSHHGLDILSNRLRLLNNSLIVLSHILYDIFGQKCIISWPQYTISYGQNIISWSYRTHYKICVYLCLFAGLNLYEYDLHFRTYIILTISLHGHFNVCISSRPATC